MAQGLKRCNKCGEHKLVEAFSKCTSKKDGLAGQCKACHSAYFATYHVVNREKLNARRRSRYEANRKEEITYQKNRYEANREKLNAYKRAHYATNKEKELARNKTYRAANRNKLSERRKAYCAANRDKLNERASARNRHAANTLSNSYIKRLLTTNTALRAADIPQSLIEAKRTHIQLLRALKEQS